MLRSFECRLRMNVRIAREPHVLLFRSLERSRLGSFSGVWNISVWLLRGSIIHESGSDIS